MTRIVRVVATGDEMAAEALHEVLRAEAEAVAARRVFHIALSGGSTVVLLLAALARREGEGSSFARWHVWFADERFVPPDHADSNYRLAEHALLSRVPIPRAQIHRVRTELGDPARAAAHYEETIRATLSPAPGETPRFDAVVMGMGPDGHTGSLFPGADVLRETERLVSPAFVGTTASPRVTLTPPVFRAARSLLYLVGGATKAAAVAGVLEGREGEKPPARFPARLLEPRRGRFCWVLDRAAAGALRDR